MKFTLRKVGEGLFLVRVEERCPLVFPSLEAMGMRDVSSCRMVALDLQECLCVSRRFASGCVRTADDLKKQGCLVAVIGASPWVRTVIERAGGDIPFFEENGLMDERVIAGALAPDDEAGVSSMEKAFLWGSPGEEPDGRYAGQGGRKDGTGGDPGPGGSG